MEARYVNCDMIKKKIKYNKKKIHYLADIFDIYYYKNVISGNIITNKVYPLIFNKQTNSKLINYRNIEFYSQINNSNTYLNLSADDKIQYGVGLRDLYYAFTKKILDCAESKMLFNVIENTLCEEPFIFIFNMGVHFFPSQKYNIPKFIDASDFEFDDDIEQYFLKTEKQEMYLVFFAYDELSYHNFENIIPCDKYLNDLTVIKTSPLITYDNYYKMKIDIPGLLDFVNLDIYTKPLSNNRGGQRTIFYSNKLSNILYDVLKDVVINKMDEKNFVSVNTVFRLNKFEPSDNKFQCHYDTPYYDPNNNIISKYTLLLYLKGGKGKNILKIDNVSINKIESMSAIIFRQNLEHEGNPYLNGSKIFIRTELLFKEKITHNKKIAKIFTKAIYHTKEQPLSKIPDQYYNLATQLHFGLKKYENVQDVYYEKKYCKIPFITNGYDYFFPKINIQDAAIIALFDYTNPIINKKSFKKLCTSNILKSNKVEKTINDLNFLYQSKQYGSESIFKKLIRHPFVESDDSICCDFHFNPDDSEPVWISSEIADIVEYANKKCKVYQDGAYIIILGNKVYLDRNNIIVKNNCIYIGYDGTQKILNFASCWNCETTPKDYLDYLGIGKCLNAIIPPIMYTETENYYHLMVHMFQNDFVYEFKDQKIMVPDDVSDVDDNITLVTC